MTSKLSRRSLLQSAASATVFSAASSSRMKADNAWTPGSGMPKEGPGTPKIGAPVNGRNLTDEAMRAVKQLGVDYVLMGGGPMPWDAGELTAQVGKLKAGGLVLGNVMISGFPNTIYGKPGRDEEIEKFKTSIRAAGKAGLPVIEYNFYAHRAIEGYTRRKAGPAPD